MTTLLVFLAFLGGAALLARLTRALLRLGVTTAEATAAAGLAEVSARRGDLTALAERREAERKIRRARRKEALFTALWLALLVVPLLAGWVREVYPVAALLWLLPRRPLLIRRTS